MVRRAAEDDVIRRALLFVLVLTALESRAETMRLDQYLASLEHLDVLLATNQRELARSEARTLMTYDVASAQGTFHTDESLLGAIADTRNPPAPLRARLALTIAELRRATGIDGTEADRRLLEEVAQAQEVEDLEAGGTINPVPAEIPMIERLVEPLARIVEWIAEAIRDLWRWLKELLPDSRGSGATGGMRWIVIVVTVLIALLIVVLAFVALRRARRGSAEAAVSSEPIGSERDEDPLSRGSTEWERYATQLAAEGRHREAIRAWFHAVLVTCYSMGILHFRKGRTNWEYIAALSPSYTWRPQLIALTRRFEYEWYGSDRSTEEALDECSTYARRILDALHRSKGAAA